jgi:hypothetical protein
LKGVDPGRAAHAAEENVAHNHEGHDCAAKPKRDKPAANRIKSRPAAHNANDDVGNQQNCLN